MFVFKADIPAEDTTSHELHDRHNDIPSDVNHGNTSLLKLSGIDQYSYN